MPNRVSEFAVLFTLVIQIVILLNLIRVEWIHRVIYKSLSQRLWRVEFVAGLRDTSKPPPDEKLSLWKWWLPIKKTTTPEEKTDAAT